MLIKVQADFESLLHYHLLAYLKNLRRLEDVVGFECPEWSRRWPPLQNRTLQLELRLASLFLLIECLYHRLGSVPIIDRVGFLISGRARLLLSFPFCHRVLFRNLNLLWRHICIFLDLFR